MRAGSSAHVRRIVFKRDKGVCAICGIDTVAARAAFMELWMVSGRPAKQWMPWESIDDEPVLQARISERLDYWLRRIKLNFGGDFSIYTLYDRKNWWDADHITPVAEGGGQCGLDGYRTLCLGCHQDVTQELRLRLRAKRREQAA